MTTFDRTSADCHQALNDAGLSRREGIWPLRWAEHEYPQLHRLLEADRLASAARGRLVPPDLDRFVTAMQVTMLRALDDFRPYIVVPIMLDDLLHHEPHAGDAVYYDRIRRHIAHRCMAAQEDRRGSAMFCLLMSDHSADHGWSCLRGHRAMALHAEHRLAGPYPHDTDSNLPRSCTENGRVYTVRDHFEPGGHYFDDAGHHPSGADVGARWGPW